MTVKGRSDFADLLVQVRGAGLMDRRLGYYVWKITITGLLFAGGWAVFFWIGASWLSLFVAAFFAVIMTQFGFLGHDAGHKQIFATKQANRTASFVFGNLFIGLSTGWWDDKHNRHHANPNNVGKDPDVAPGAFAFTKEQAAQRGPFGRFMARIQAWLFFPLLLLEGLNLHVASIRAMFGGTIKSWQQRLLESILLLVNLSLYLFAVFTVLTPAQGFAFVAVNKGLWGLHMGLSFAPNHKGREMVTDADNRDFLRKQVLTSRNLHGNWLTDWLLGGLNYQIEHHLFPSMPRPSLRLVQPIVRAYCQKIDVAYAEVGARESYGIVLGYLNDVGHPVAG